MTGAVTAQSDDPFLRTLTTDAPLDRRALAQFVQRVSSTLEAGKEGVGLLQIAAESRVPDTPFVDRATVEIGERFEAYAEALGDFSAAASDLAGEPTSARRLFRVLISGQRACWLLERHLDLAQSYGVNAGRLREVQAASAACSRLHHAMFQPRVIESIDGELFDARDKPGWMRENQALKEELRALEQLLEDLRTIDAQP